MTPKQTSQADLLLSWLAKAEEAAPSLKRGKARVYSDQAILCGLRLREVYRLPLRATTGFLRSLIVLLGAEVPVPCCIALSRRQAGLTVPLEAPASDTSFDTSLAEPLHLVAEPLHLVVDGTGLKVYGDGAWKVRQHGPSKRRPWRKVHLAVDEKTGYIQVAATTTNSVSDGEMLPMLLERVEQPIAQVSADGGYHRRRLAETAMFRCSCSAKTSSAGGTCLCLRLLMHHSLL